MTVDVSKWGQYGPRPEPNHDLDALFAAMTATLQIEVTTTTDAAWELVSDIERIGQCSPECVEAWWVAGFPARAVGGRFEGRNRVIDGDHTYEWIRVCEVLSWRPGAEFSWFAGDRFDGTPASRWAFHIVPGPRGVIIRQDFAHYPDGLSGVRAGAEADPAQAADFVAARLAALRDGMTATLARMKSLLEDRGDGLR